MEQLSLRKATQEDAKMLFEWKNEALTRKNSFSSEPVPWESHIAWFEKKLKDENCLFYIMCENGADVGTFRIEIDPETATGLMHVTVDKDCRGNHTVQRILAVVEEEVKGLSLKYLLAEVKPHNIASQKALDKNNYHVLERTEEEIIYRKQIG